jgi:hypothetical protein
VEPVLRDALTAAGWYEGRSVDIQNWLRLLEAEGFIMHDGARAALTEFGGLRIKPVVKNVGGSLRFDPYDAASGLADVAATLASDYREIYSPIGMWSAQYVSYLGESGRVLAMGPGWDWELGNSFESALEFVARGRQDVTCVKVRTDN